MNVADLFINIAVTGADKTVGAFTGITKGLEETKSASLEAKAAILAAMYATQQLFSQSGQAGTDLTNFNAILGVSAKTLQQYQYAARQVGVSNQEVEGSFKSLQSAMTKTLMGKGAPAGLARVADLTGGISEKDLKAYAEKPQLLIQRLQEYAKREKNAGLRNETLKSFGLSDNFTAALTRNAFTDKQLNKAPVYSDSEIDKLDRANIAWSNLSNKIQMAVGHFNAMHGGQIVNDISMITDKVLKLAEAFITLADKLKFFEGVGKAFEGWAAILGGANTAVTRLSGAAATGGTEGVAKEVGGALGGAKDAIAELINGYIANQAADAEIAKRKTGLFGPMTPGLEKQDARSKVPASMVRPEVGPKLAPSEKPGTENKPIVTKPVAAPVNSPAPLRLVPPPTPILTPNAATPNVAPVAPKAGNTQNVEISQTLNFNGDGSNAKQTGDSVKKAVQDAFRQRSAQVQVN